MDLNFFKMVVVVVLLLAMILVPSCGYYMYRKLMMKGESTEANDDSKDEEYYDIGEPFSFYALYGRGEKKSSFYFSFIFSFLLITAAVAITAYNVAVERYFIDKLYQFVYLVIALCIIAPFLSLRGEKKSKRIFAVCLSVLTAVPFILGIVFIGLPESSPIIKADGTTIQVGKTTISEIQKAGFEVCGIKKAVSSGSNEENSGGDSDSGKDSEGDSDSAEDDGGDENSDSGEKSDAGSGSGIIMVPGERLNFEKTPESVIIDTGMLKTADSGSGYSYTYWIVQDGDMQLKPEETYLLMKDGLRYGKITAFGSKKGSTAINQCIVTRYIFNTSDYKEKELRKLNIMLDGQNIFVLTDAILNKMYGDRIHGTPKFENAVSGDNKNEYTISRRYSQHGDHSLGVWKRYFINIDCYNADIDIKSLVVRCTADKYK